MPLTPTDRDIFRLAVPALGALAADPLVSLVDTAFVGQLGAVPLGALGVNAALFSLAFLVFNFLAYGTTPLVAQAVGRGDTRAAGDMVRHALAFAVGAGLVAGLALETLAEPLLALMGATGALAEDALVYLRIRALAAPAVLVVLAGHGAYRGFQDTRMPLWITLALNVVNLVLDPLLIFGAGWGLAGAAWATVAAQYVGAGLFVLLLWPRVRTEGGWQRAVFSKLVGIGGALAVRTGALIGTLTLATAVATRLGAESVAAHQVANQLWLLLALIVDALAVAGQALVARHRGAGNMAEARRVSDRLLAWGLGLGVVLTGAFYLVQPLLLDVFTDDAEVIRLLGLLFPFIAWMQPLNALVFVWDGVYMGAEAFGYLARAMLISAVVGVALLLAVIPLGWGLTGVWWAIVAFMGMRLVTLGVRYPRLLPAEPADAA